MNRKLDEVGKRIEDRRAERRRREVRKEEEMERLGVSSSRSVKRKRWEGRKRNKTERSEERRMGDERGPPDCPEQG